MDDNWLTEFLGPAFKLEMLQHTRKYAFVTHVGGKFSAVGDFS
jgi:hypothetical protein